MKLHCPCLPRRRKPLASKGGKRARRTCETRHPKGDKDMGKSTKHMSKAERQQAREKAQERAQAALDRLDEGVREVYESERWRLWLDSLAKFHDYGLGNTILICMQMPDAPHVTRRRRTPTRSAAASWASAWATSSTSARPTASPCPPS